MKPDDAEGSSSIIDASELWGCINVRCTGTTEEAVDTNNKIQIYYVWNFPDKSYISLNFICFSASKAKGVLIDLNDDNAYGTIYYNISIFNSEVIYFHEILKLIEMSSFQGTK